MVVEIHLSLLRRNRSRLHSIPQIKGNSTVLNVVVCKEHTHTTETYPDMAPSGGFLAPKKTVAICIKRLGVKCRFRISFAFRIPNHFIWDLIQNQHSYSETLDMYSPLDLILEG